MVDCRKVSTLVSAELISKKAVWEEDSEKSEMVTCKDNTKFARNISVWFIWSKSLGRMGHNMLKWLVIIYWISWPYAYIKVSYALNLLRENIIWLLMKILDIDLTVTNKKNMQKYKKIFPYSVDTLNS